MGIFKKVTPIVIYLIFDVLYLICYNGSSNLAIEFHYITIKVSYICACISRTSLQNNARILGKVEEKERVVVVVT